MGKYNARKVIKIVLLILLYSKFVRDIIVSLSSMQTLPEESTTLLITSILFTLVFTFIITYFLKDKETVKTVVKKKKSK